MQRLPYNGALRAHKLRHNVISSSLFNERWQPYVHTHIQPNAISLSVFNAFSQSLARLPSPKSLENLLQAASIALSSQSNVIHLLIVAPLPLFSFTDRYHFLRRPSKAGTERARFRAEVYRLLPVHRAPVTFRLITITLVTHRIGSRRISRKPRARCTLD